MEIDKLLKLTDLDRPRNAFDQMHETTLRAIRTSNAFDQMHEVSLRALRDSNAFNFHDELYRTKMPGLFDSTMASSLQRHIDGLNESIAVRVLRDPVFGNAKESLFLAAQSQVEQSWRGKLTELTAGFSARSASQVSGEFLSRIKAGVLPQFHSYIESETAALTRSIRMAAEYPSAVAFASLTATMSATSFINAAKWMRDLQPDAGIMKRFFEPSVAYGHFATRTLEQIGNPINESHRAALAGSLLLANTQAIRTASLLTPLAEYGGGAPETNWGPVVVSPRPIINRYRLQREELVHREEEISEEADYESLIPLAPSAGLYDMARRCLELVGLCIETNETCTGDTVFKLTPMVLLSFSGLLGTVAQNRATLAQVVENLYVVLYESAGKDKLRYLELNYLTREECEIIWKIKHLRNKWLSHDAEHGSEGKIREARRLRLDALQWLGVERVPIRQNEYARVQSLLLEKVEEFLTLLLTRIAGADESINSSSVA